MLLNVTFAASIAGERIYKCIGRPLIVGSDGRHCVQKTKQTKDSFGFFISGPAVRAVRRRTYTQRGRVAVTCDLFFFFFFVKSAMKSAAETQTVVDSLDDSLHCLRFVKVNVLLENSPLCKK